jgi:hypothetical protein
VWFVYTKFHEHGVIISMITQKVNSGSTSSRPAPALKVEFVGWHEDYRHTKVDRPALVWCLMLVYHKNENSQVHGINTQEKA